MTHGCEVCGVIGVKRGACLVEGVCTRFEKLSECVKVLRVLVKEDMVQVPSWSKVNGRCCLNCFTFCDVLLFCLSCEPEAPLR